MTGSGSARRTERHRLSPRALVAALLIAFAPFPAGASSCDTPKGLETFHAALRSIESGERSHPLTILHLGDSHIALDNFTRGLRTRWTEAYGDAGRGLMPGVPFRYYAPDGFALDMKGKWEMVSSLPAHASGIFGIQGFRADSEDRAAVMSLRSEAPVSRIIIDVYGTPHSGAFFLQIGDAAALKLQTKQEAPGFLQLSVPAAGADEVRLSPAGTGVVHILGWTLLSSASPGARYDSFGIVAATASVTSRWDRTTVTRQIAAMKPDLVILGYGTNEGFNNGLDLDGYRKLVAGLADTVVKAAPGASIALLGPFDGARQGSGEECSGGWRTPPKLEGVRGVLRSLAASRGYFFWDGATAMGGRCAANEWAKADPPLMYADRVHLRPAGAERLSASLWNALMARGSAEGSCNNKGGQG